MFFVFHSLKIRASVCCGKSLSTESAWSKHPLSVISRRSENPLNCDSVIWSIFSFQLLQFLCFPNCNNSLTFQICFGMQLREYQGKCLFCFLSLENNWDFLFPCAPHFCCCLYSSSTLLDSYLTFRMVISPNSWVYPALYLWPLWDAEQ